MSQYKYTIKYYQFIMELYSFSNKLNLKKKHLNLICLKLLF